MKFALLISSACAVSVAAQSTWYYTLPPCAIDCAKKAAEAARCPIYDLKCLCNSRIFPQVFLDCLYSNCGPDVGIAAYDLWKKYCTDPTSTVKPTTTFNSTTFVQPTTVKPTTTFNSTTFVEPTTVKPTTTFNSTTFVEPTTVKPTTTFNSTVIVEPTTVKPTETFNSTRTVKPTTDKPTTTFNSSTIAPTTVKPTITIVDPTIITVKPTVKPTIPTIITVDPTMTLTPVDPTLVAL